MIARTLPFSSRRCIVAVALGGAFVLSDSIGFAAVLAEYEFTGNSNASTDDDTLNAMWTAGDFTVGPGIDANDGFVAAGNPAPSRSVRVDDTTTNESGAVAADDYFQFTITPTTGFSLNLTDLSLDFAATFSPQARGYAIRSSLDSFSATVLNYVQTTEASNTFVNRSVDLTGASFQNLSAPITFRIYAFDNASSTGNTLRFDNVVVNGTAVPEPMTTGLLVVGVLGLLTLRQRRTV